MTDTSRTSSHSPVAHPRVTEYPTRNGTAVSGWTGWVVFGGLMLVMLGIFQMIEGLVALFDRGYYLVGPEGLVVDVDFTTWGWVHLILGVAAIAAGLGLMAGNMAARWVGVAVAVISATVNLAFVAAYPVWSLLVIGIDFLVIYAIIVHGRELKAA